MQHKFRKLGSRLTSKVVISELVLVPYACAIMNRRTSPINAWPKVCRIEGFRFLDHCDHFWGMLNLYKLNGFHLKPNRTNIPAGRWGEKC